MSEKLICLFYAICFFLGIATLGVFMFLFGNVVKRHFRCCRLQNNVKTLLGIVKYLWNQRDFLEKQLYHYKCESAALGLLWTEAKRNYAEVAASLRKVSEECETLRKQKEKRPKK